MAIRRCPYCKAIIDEGSEYCSNCGTQLIFPEDEFVEEEIPGDKIIDVNEEDSEPQESKNPAKGKRSSAKGKSGRKKASVPDKEKGKVAEVKVDATKDEVKETEPEAELVEEFEPESDLEPDSELETEPETEAKPEDEEIGEDEGEELPVHMQEDDSAELPSEELLEPEEDLAQKVEEEAEEEAEERAAPDESADFRTEDLEGMVDPAEKEKEEIEKFLDSLKEEREKTKKYYEETGELPPWAQNMREAKATEVPFEDEEDYGGAPIEPDEGEEGEVIKKAADFEESFVEESVEKPSEEEPVELDKEIPAQYGELKEEEPVRPADTGMGLPEGVDQQNLPFSQGVFESTTAKEKKSRYKKPDVSFSPWIKSRIFDVLIIVGGWLVAIWLASRIAGIGFFRLLTTSTVQTLVFLVILFVIYFFLFLFFLGETLGDHLFSEEL
jgi:hypothetical protein